MKYESLEDMPIYNFVHCMDGDLRYLYNPKQTPAQGDHEYFMILASEHMNIKGFKQEAKYYENVLKMVANDDKQAKNNVLIYEADQTKGQKRDIINDFYVNLAALNKALGLAIDPHACSTKLFYSYVKIAQHNGKK